MLVQADHVIVIVHLSVYRKSVKELLELEFFTEWGVQVEAQRTSEPDIIQFRIKYDDKKRKDVHKKDEAIQFDFNISKDDAEVIVKEMVWLSVFH